MNHPSTDQIKVKQEPLEAEDDQQHEKLDLIPSNITPESKSKDNKTVHCKSFVFFVLSLQLFLLALLFTCDDCGIRYSNRNTLDAHREHYCTKRDLNKTHSTGKSIEISVNLSL